MDAEPTTDTQELTTLVALTPADMGPAQAALVEWCSRKIAAVQAELDDLQTNHLTLIESGMQGFALARAMARTEKRVTYYAKIKAAVEAGYLIVPNFPIDVFAVRVARTKPRAAEKSSKWRGFSAEPELLPAGEGRYVDDQLIYRDESYTEKIDGKPDRTIARYVIDDYDAVDFPFRAVKPAVLQATQRAMAARLFDELGVVHDRARRGDPIVVGRLIDPVGRGRAVTFFIAWWLDVATL